MRSNKRNGRESDERNGMGGSKQNERKVINKVGGEAKR